MLKYKGYTGHAEIDFEANEINGYVLDLNDVITFEGRTPEEVENEFRKSIDIYLAFCKEKGIKPDRPFSGTFTVRATPDLHKRITVRAAKEGKSLNQWVSEACEAHLKSDHNEYSRSFMKVIQQASTEIRTGSYGRSNDISSPSESVTLLSGQLSGLATNKPFRRSNGKARN